MYIYIYINLYTIYYGWSITTLVSVSPAKAGNAANASNASNASAASTASAGRAWRTELSDRGVMAWLSVEHGVVGSERGEFTQ